MLSYQHGYHAGNLADVQKHALLAWMLDYLISKDKPLTYIETHAGRGLYWLDAPEALKTGEAAAGIGRMEAGFAQAHPYRRCLDEVRARFGPAAYPGSPLLAALWLRPADRLHLAELHPQEHAALSKLLVPFGARVVQEDGFSMALSLAPPTPRRGMVLIDPSYEVKEDYDAVPRFIAALHRKWNVGVIALWYPILAERRHIPMLDALAATYPGAFRHEATFARLREGHRMVGTGVFVVNPPYGIQAEAARLSEVFAARA